MMTATSLKLPTRQIPIHDIHTSARVRDLDQAVVSEYAERLAAGDEFPPLTVFADSKAFYLGDGFHRLAAMVVAEVGKTATCRVEQGVQRDARLFACGANRTNGHRRSNEDKRAAVFAMLSEPAWMQWSDRLIAQHVGVSHTFVANLRREMVATGNGCQSLRREGADGRVIDTSRIGSASRSSLADEPQGGGARSAGAANDASPGKSSEARVIPLRASAAGTYDLREGHVLDRLREMPDGSVHACITSPPYYQVRDYNTAPVAWGGDPSCTHEFGADSACKCGAWRGELGQEPTVELYVDHLDEVFREIRRVLRPDGSLWLNLGDTLKDGSLSLAPERVVLALQSEGWAVRNRITWEKRNPKPSSARKRVRDTTEAVFVLSPTSHAYYYDDWALMDESRHEGLCRGTDVWRVSATHDGNRGGHVAPFPAELARRCVTAGTSAIGCCPVCRTPYRRIIEQQKKKMTGGTSWTMTLGFATLGWDEGCSCHAGPPIPCTVLDPFAGSGVTLETAVRHGRAALGIELNPEYADGARARLAAIEPLDEAPDLRLAMGEAPLVATSQDAA